MANVVAIIPARYAATRLPGKPLLKETGKYLIQHVFESVRSCTSIQRTIVATDDERILQAVESFGGEAVLTSPDHPNGTCRVAEAAGKLDADLILNIQGDEPELPGEYLEELIAHSSKAEMATLAIPFDRDEEATDPARVKVVLDRQGYALYFSRSKIPSGNGIAPLLHVGLYGFRRDALERFASWEQTPLEKSESLEQLRALENGLRIKVGLVRGRPLGGIDTAEDYRAFVQRWRERER